MRFVNPGLGLSLAAMAVAALLSSCGPSRAELQAETARVAAVEAAAVAARQPPPIVLNEGVAQSASIYLTFIRDMTTIQAGFASPEAIQEALRRGAASDPQQISRGLVAYASIVALQSPEFVAGIRQVGDTPEARRRLVDRVVAEPSFAATLPGAEAAAGLVMSVLEADIVTLNSAADAVESDAYTIQYAGDPRSGWARPPGADREGRLQAIKDLSARGGLPSATEAARLHAAAVAGAGLGVTTARTRRPPYPQSVTNALAMATLATLGVAGDNARANTDALQYDRASLDCLSSSRLNLFQCLAASRPAYEDMFCLGRHVMRDLSTCARGAALPAAIVTVGDPSQTGATPPARSLAIAPADIVPVTPPTPLIRTTPIDPTPSPAPRADQSPTQRLNAGPNR